MKKKNTRALVFILLVLTAPVLYAQMENLHGEESALTKGVHSGNQVRHTFYNDGTDGGRTTDDFRGEWPINNKNSATYLVKSCLLVGAEVVNENNERYRIISESHGTQTADRTHASCGDLGPNLEWYTFTPLPGFYNTENPEELKLAMSHKKRTWPSYWPDKNLADDPGWPGSWNGYFGRNQYNADQESYFVVDDYNNAEFPFFPDSLNHDRRGLGMRVTCRGLQWANPLVADAIFQIFDVKNVGTYTHDKVLFGKLCGPNIGGSVGHADGIDDLGEYLLTEDLGISYDESGGGNPGEWGPVGLLGYAFLESPGNPWDGIDNDNDGIMGSGDIISEAMFAEKVVNAGDEIVIIDYETYERRVTAMPEDGLEIAFLDKIFSFKPGDVLQEIELDQFDNNLNGIIDENNGYIFSPSGEMDSTAQVTYLYVGNKYKNWLTGSGLDNPLIDERRDDGIDNNNNWNPDLDDVGLDGDMDYFDTGQSDGQPTSGWQNGVDTGLPGEPHIDKTDIHESDMIGLTAFDLTDPWDTVPLHDDELVWESIRPGHLESYTPQSNNTDVNFGSGFFALKPEQIERFSTSFLFSYSRDGLIREKQVVDIAYESNYNFAKAPLTPKLTAVAGDGRVTLYWDDLAESSYDALSQSYDFEGYRLYRSRDPRFSEMEPIYDAYGDKTLITRKPLAQWDLDNEFYDFHPVAIKGVQFYVGRNSGLVHSFVDTTVKNGYKYFYALTSYDHGSDSLGISPTECPIVISVDMSGEISEIGRNVAVVIPQVRAAGYRQPQPGAVVLKSGRSDGLVNYSILDERRMKPEHTYQVTFSDTSTGEKEFFPSTNVLFNLTDITNPDVPVSVLGLSGKLADPPVVEGLKLRFDPVEFSIDMENTGWDRRGIRQVEVEPYSRSRVYTKATLADYRIEFGDIGADTSTFIEGISESRYPAIPVNFKVINTTTGRQIEFAIQDRAEDNMFNWEVRNDNIRSDELILIEQENDSVKYASYVIEFDRDAVDSLPPEPGDVLEIKTIKPFSTADVFEFQTPGFEQRVKTENLLDKVKVVPNPYVVANSYEPLNPYTTGRGPRQLHFNHLPAKCTIKIFNMQGQLVDEIFRNSTVFDGTEIWDMRTLDNMDIGFGVYIYHIDAPGYGQKIGKFAVIK